jgi:hypothetical protein
MRTTSLPDIDPDEISDWFAGKLPEDWQVHPPALTVDDDEILAVVTIADAASADAASADSGTTDADVQTAARLAAIRRFREETRGRRMEIAASAEGRFGRRVSWGVRSGESVRLFTHLSMPTMTRLRITERLVLDTLIEGGVARSRSDALSWCVRMTGRNLDTWLTDLRQAVTRVDEVRRSGPDSPGE